MSILIKSTSVMPRPLQNASSVVMRMGWPLTDSSGVGVNDAPPEFRDRRYRVPLLVFSPIPSEAQDYSQRIIQDQVLGG